MVIEIELKPEAPAKESNGTVVLRLRVRLQSIW
jgi:hypothetical protein